MHPTAQFLHAFHLVIALAEIPIHTHKQQLPASNPAPVVTTRTLQIAAFKLSSLYMTITPTVRHKYIGMALRHDTRSTDINIRTNQHVGNFIILHWLKSASIMQAV